MAEIIRRWCSSEKEKYSPDLIDKLDEYENELLPIARKNKNRKGKKIPSTMIINHFTKSYPRPKVLLGPYKLEYLTGNTPNGKLRIYNLHDYHRHITKKNKEHMFASEWILETLKNSDVFIDVFLEYDIPFKGHNLKKRPSWYYNQGELTKTIGILEDCMIHKKGCPTPNSRVHGADVRKRQEIISEFEKIIRRNKGEKLTKSTVKSLREYIHNILQTKKIKKQFINTPDCIRNEIFNIIDNRFLEELEKIKHISSDEILEDTGAIIGSSIGVILMDAYLLGRLFRKFDIRPSDKGMSENIQNVIIYAGGEHSEFYTKVLQKCGFKLKYSVGVTGKTIDYALQKGELIKYMTLDISNIPYPLFRD